MKSETLKELENFRQFASLKVNKSKTSIIRVGHWPNAQQKLYAASSLKCTNEPVKILGILIHLDKEIMIEINYSTLLQKVRDKILMWRYRTLTPYGKVQIINTLLGSLFAYKLQCLPLPPDAIKKKYKELIIKFLWAGYADKVNYEKTIQQYSVGGLKLMDLEAKDIALKTSWVAKLNNENISEIFYVPLPIKSKLI